MNISIDPSGTGTTCLFIDKKLENFTNKEWIEHFKYVRKIILNNHCLDNPITVYLEIVKSAYNNKNADLIPLIQVITAIQLLCLEYKITIITVTSDQTKRYARWFKDYIPSNECHYKRNIKKIKFIKNTKIIFEKNKFFYQNKKISTHERDAILIYYIGKQKILIKK